MEIGDLVVVEKTNKSIDAIGVITGDYVYDESQSKYPRSREVKWLVKNIDYNVVPFINGRKQLSRFSLFAFDYIGLGNILEILNKYQKNSIAVSFRVDNLSTFIFCPRRGRILKYRRAENASACKWYPVLPMKPSGRCGAFGAYFQ